LLESADDYWTALPTLAQSRQGGKYLGSMTSMAGLQNPRGFSALHFAAYDRATKNGQTGETVFDFCDVGGTGAKI
jgi:hypothetical protein